MNHILRLALFTLSLVTACSVDEPVHYDIRGRVTAVDTTGRTPARGKEQGSVARIMVVGTKDSTSAYDRASIALFPETRVMIVEGSRLLGGNADSIRVGDSVGVLFDGAVAESYPVQATAGRVVKFRR